MRGQALKNEFLKMRPRTLGEDYITGIDEASDGLIMEFGVFKGTSINILAGLLGDKKIYGFDSFEGLPEDWVKAEGMVNPKGMYKTELPEVRDNVVLVKGLFQDTLPEFLTLNKGYAGYVHIDCDLYSSAMYVLETLNSRIALGTIIRFDELCDWTGRESYEKWAHHEWRALNEWMEKFDRDVRPLCRTESLHGTVRVVK